MKKFFAVPLACVLLSTGCASTAQLRHVEGKETANQKTLRETDQRLNALEQSVATLDSQVALFADEQTLEARTYGFGRFFRPFMVNNVSGFIGPETIYDGKEMIRANLEDHFMGKLTGISMGVDACYTNHMKADQNDIENLSVLLTAAGCNYFMGIPAGDDIMLNYQCTGYHEAPSLRELFDLSPTKEFAAWMEKMGITENGKLSSRAGDASIFLKK